MTVLQRAILGGLTQVFLPELLTPPAYGPFCSLTSQYSY
ncbi:hypothetical protein IFVP18_C150560 [Vibrio parahaemolyticus]